ncbi:hypothetical protein [Motiliproteus sp. MSK22-1]|uniref:hypothetical protein n=1 Tax=Motiliproteus sp. MSK22-1 TaxID=1897630 RepID=UPI0009782643|nr:hypothetical protein [Motiliproteus sp. MSK22-1]OMH31752.1 hypothetical protein BGP75_16665 [Motiliproteus sp. MSK22-1]
MSIALNKQLPIFLALLLTTLFSIGVVKGADLVDVRDHCASAQMKHEPVYGHGSPENISADKKELTASGYCNHKDLHSCALQCAASGSVTAVLIKELHELPPQSGIFTLDLVAALPEPLPESIHRPPLV